MPSSQNWTVNIRDLKNNCINVDLPADTNKKSAGGSNMNMKGKNEPICICNNVSFRQIEDCVDAGATSYEDILEKTGAGSVCGGCIERIEDILNNLMHS
jgi:NAD(P)H-nitrite reductase large subunit